MNTADDRFSERSLAELLREALDSDLPPRLEPDDRGWPRVPGFRILAPIGAGGAGRVFLAEQFQPRRAAAVKVLRRGADATAADAARLEREAATLARLRHPAIPCVYAAGRTDGGAPFMAMELVEGATLAKWLEGAPPWGARFAVLAEVAEAVAAAHAAGVLHRDIKSSNVVVRCDGHAVLVDFGLAIAPESPDPRLTLTHAIQGTPAFTSPEQLEGLPADAASNVFSLGVLVHQAIDGRHPFLDHVGSWMDVARAMAERSPRALPRGVPKALAQAIQAALQRDPMRRTIDAAGLAAALNAAAQCSRCSEAAASRQRATSAPRLLGVAARVAAIAAIAALASGSSSLPAQLSVVPEPTEPLREWRPSAQGPFPLPLGPGCVIADEQELAARCAAMDAAPSQEGSPLERAYLFELLGRTDEALAFVDAALAEKSGPTGRQRDRLALLCRRARIMLAGGDFESAQLVMDEIDTEAAGNGELIPRVLAEVLLTRAELLLARGDLGAARQDLLDVIDLGSQGRGSIDRRQVPGGWVMVRACCALDAIDEAFGDSSAADDWRRHAGHIGQVALRRSRTGITVPARSAPASP